MEEKSIFLLFIILLTSEKNLCEQVGDEAFDGDDAALIFDEFDEDQDSIVSKGEFVKAMQGTEDYSSEDHDSDVEIFFRKSDLDRDGHLSREEMIKAFYLNGDSIQSLESSIESKSKSTAVSKSPSKHRVFQPMSLIPTKSNARYVDIIDEKPHPTKLYDIICTGNFTLLKFSLSKFYSPDAGAHEGMCSPLHVALKLHDQWNLVSHLSSEMPPREYENMALLLIEHGADLLLRCEGRTALHLAVQFRSHRAVDAIISK